MEMDNDALRPKFEAPWLGDFLSLEWSDAESRYYSQEVQKRWEGFLLGYAAGMEDAAVVCDEWATQFEPSTLAPGIDHYSAKLLRRLAEAIRAKAKGEQ